MAEANIFNLPSDAVKFLQAGRQLVYDPKAVEAGELKLKQFDKLELKEIWITNEMVDDDPHVDENGYYSIPAVSLTAQREDFDAEFLLSWLPNEKQFGAWDSDHWVVTVFPGATWADIVTNPAPYLNAQWDVDTKVGTQLKAWLNYPFKAGSPL